MLFLSAGTVAYWPAWIWLCVLGIPVFGIGVYLLVNDREFLEKRMRTYEQRSPQRFVIYISLIWLVATFVAPGLDWRFGWSREPAWLIWLCNALMGVAYGLLVWSLLSNRFASRVVEIQQGQQVISTGPYAVVRHPMYLSGVFVYCLSAPALGSYWAIIPAVLIIPIFIVRIRNEEQLLLEALPGYAAYTRRVRWRLLPGVW